MGNILVVDDSGIIRFQVRKILKEMNYRIFEAADGRQVLSNTFSKNFSLEDMDLILLDIYLGEIDGYEVLKYLSTNYPNLPVVIMSIEGKKENILKCIELGARDYILKPFNKEVLTFRVKRFISSGDIKVLDETLFVEVERAIRTNTSFTVLIIKINFQKSRRNNIIYLKGKLQKILRKIDSVFIFNNCIILILPLANKDGVEIVKRRIAKAFTEVEINYEQTHQETFFYPDDVSDKELIQNFNTNAIKLLILHKINQAI